MCVYRLALDTSVDLPCSGLCDGLSFGNAGCRPSLQRCAFSHNVSIPDASSIRLLGLSAASGCPSYHNGSYILQREHVRYGFLRRRDVHIQCPTTRCSWRTPGSRAAPARLGPPKAVECSTCTPTFLPFPSKVEEAPLGCSPWR
jgi:hypothetical protein